MKTGKCPHCGQRVKIITSQNGSKIPVNWTADFLWFHEDDETQEGFHKVKWGYRTHYKTCSKGLAETVCPEKAPGCEGTFKKTHSLQMICKNRACFEQRRKRFQGKFKLKARLKTAGCGK